MHTNEYWLAKDAQSNYTNTKLKAWFRRLLRHPARKRSGDTRGALTKTCHMWSKLTGWGATGVQNLVFRSDLSVTSVSNATGQHTSAASRFSALSSSILLSKSTGASRTFLYDSRRPGCCPKITEIPEILKFVLKCPEIGVRSWNLYIYPEIFTHFHNFF